MDVTDIINACDRKLRAHGLDALTRRERLVALANLANFEVTAGGVGAFFHNASGNLAREVVDALIELGAMDEAAAVNRGRELLKKRSWRQLATASEFERLTDRFLVPIPGLFERVTAFAELHAEELQSTAQQAFPGNAENVRA